MIGTGGINLKTYLHFNGVYPDKNKIIEMVNHEDQKLNMEI